MSWPSGTKASTNNVDQGSDKISLARADIKQNIDNVNDMIDHLNIASPSDGDLLRYSSSSGKWEQVASTAIQTFPTALLCLKTGQRIVGQAGGAYTMFPELEIVSDPGGLVTLGNGSNTFQEDSAGETYLVPDSAGQIPAFALATGYYLLQFVGSWKLTGGGQTFTYALNGADNPQLTSTTNILSFIGQSENNFTPKLSMSSRRYYYLSIVSTGVSYDLTPSLSNHGRIMITKIA